MHQPDDQEKLTALKSRITDEIFFALGFSRRGFVRRVLGPLFYLPASHFIEIIAHIEDEVPRTGLNGAAMRIRPDFSMTVSPRGTEFFPKEGPLLIASNHVGAFDSVAIASCIPRRDLKLFVSDVPFMRAMTATGKQLIYVPLDVTGRMAALREGIQYLQNGGALLSFAHYEVEPDPSFMPGAYESIQDWSPSIEIMLRKVPDTKLQICMASNVLLPQYVHHPITKIRRKSFEKQKVGEFLQLIAQMLFPRHFKYNVHVSFSSPSDLQQLGGQDIMPAVIQKARGLLKEHIASLPQK